MRQAEGCFLIMVLPRTTRLLNRTTAWCCGHVRAWGYGRAWSCFWIRKSGCSSGLVPPPLKSSAAILRVGCFWFWSVHIDCASDSTFNFLKMVPTPLSTGDSTLPQHSLDVFRAYCDRIRVGRFPTPKVLEFQVGAIAPMVSHEPIDRRTLTLPDRYRRLSWVGVALTGRTASVP